MCRRRRSARPQHVRRRGQRDGGSADRHPYDTQAVAQALLRAIRMPAAERRARMDIMRRQIASHSIYEWSRELLSDMRELREKRNRFWPRRDDDSLLRSTEVAG